MSLFTLNTIIEMLKREISNPIIFAHEAVIYSIIGRMFVFIEMQKQHFSNTLYIAMSCLKAGAYIISVWLKQMYLLEHYFNMSRLNIEKLSINER